ncbi:MAG TPA: class I SAM-dependent methyltransferase [Burkholderiales bacterium]|nr:class I SAM-dependent methyltransferase [Burkholderiales bacterium]
MRQSYPSPLWRALAAQAAGALGATGVAAAWSMLAGTDVSTWQWIWLQAMAASATAALLRMQWWWIVLNLTFAPALAAGLGASLSPYWSAAALIALLLVYGGTQRTRVPLYLSSKEAVGILRELLPADRPVRFLDIGAGTGSVLSSIACSHPHAEVSGIERAPVPFLIARLRAAIGNRNYRVTWGDFWSADLSGYDVVYAYLSPAPMAALWEKARREMRPGSLLVSFSFVVPGVAPSRMIPAGRDWIHVWKMP